MEENSVELLIQIDHINLPQQYEPSLDVAINAEIPPNCLMEYRTAVWPMLLHQGSDGNLRLHRENLKDLVLSYCKHLVENNEDVKNWKQHCRTFYDHNADRSFASHS
jgi:hypothetical protein